MISINAIQIYAYHGCLEEESIIGGNYLVDVKIYTDFEKAALSDNLTETVDYSSVVDIVRREMAIRSKLIEHAGRRVADSLMKDLKINGKIRIKVTKIAPPVSGQVESVSITIRRRSDSR